MFLYILVLVAVLLASFEYTRRKRRCFQNLPRGPGGIPFIGNLLQLGQKPYIQLSKWAETFGSFYTIDLSGTPALVVNDRETMRDLFGHRNATGKYSTVTVDLIDGPDYGVVNTEGSVWFEQHKFLMKAFRQIGFLGGNLLAPTIQKECVDLINLIDNELNANKTGSVNLEKALLHSVTSIVWNALCGEQQASSKNKIAILLETLVRQFNNATVLIFMPWLRFLAPERTGWNPLVKTTKEFHRQVQSVFDKRKVARKSTMKNSIPFNLIDAYLEHVENCKDQRSTFFGENGMKHSLYVVVSLLVAGGETTSSNIKWLIHYLLAYPNVQRKLQAEVDAVSEDNLQTIDKTKLPYLNAVILEVFRITSMVPCGAVHRILDDITYKGFTLPKGTLLIANLYHAHMDRNVWKDPQTFRPERFLEGTEAERNDIKEKVIPFLEGQRKCPGQYIAKHITFWYTYKLVEKYCFYKEEHINVAEYLKPVSGFMRLPPKLGIVVKRRNK